MCVSVFVYRSVYLSVHLYVYVYVYMYVSDVCIRADICTSVVIAVMMQCYAQVLQTALAT